MMLSRSKSPIWTVSISCCPARNVRAIKSDNVAYVHYNGKGGAKWRVECFDCGHTVDKGNKVRHDAQLNWNEAVKQ